MPSRRKVLRYTIQSQLERLVCLHIALVGLEDANARSTTYYPEHFAFRLLAKAESAAAAEQDNVRRLPTELHGPSVSAARGSEVEGRAKLQKRDRLRGLPIVARPGI